MRRRASVERKKELSMTTTTDVRASGLAANEAVGEAASEAALAVQPAWRVRRSCQRGMVSAEWAVGLIAAIAIAGVLVSIVTSGPVRDSLLHVVLNVIAWISGTLGGLKQ
jgi:hypothetical protein